MKILLKINRVANRHRQRRGSVIELPEAEAAVLIRTGRAVAFAEVAVEETSKPKRKKDQA